jgi:TldD protein
MSLDTLVNKLSEKVDYIELRQESYSGTYIQMRNGELEKLQMPKERGYCIRILSNGVWGFASSTDFTKIEDLVKKALKAVKVAKGKKVKINKESFSGKFENKVKIKPQDISIEEKIKLVETLDKFLRNFDKKIKASNVVYVDGSRKKSIIDSFGNEVEETIHRIRFLVSVRTKQGNIMQQSYKTYGKCSGYEIFKKFNLEKFCNEASREALELLKAKPAPAGRFDIIADQELAGVFIHEAVGHACEADNLLYDTTILKNKINKKIGSELLTVVDEPRFPEYGAYHIDEEGVKARKTILINQGILENFMTNLETSTKFGLPLTGNARALNYDNEPLVRMSCTYIANGSWTFEEILEDMKNGIYLVGFKGGQVNPAEGTFLFTAKSGYLIKNGELVKRLRDVSIGGLTLEALKNVDAVANDLQFKDGLCGKGGQSIPNTTGAPHIRIKNALVGGR